ncbi:MAG: hypothetical protein MJ237_05115 [bacterium]|nr:hypothetical protein [bacterium]
MRNGDINDLLIPAKRIQAKIRLLNLITKAKTEFDKCNLDGCEEACKRILSENPNNSTALRGLGCVMQAHNNNNKAVEYYLKALDHSEHKEIEYTLLGTLYYGCDDYENALKYYNLAIEANDDYDEAYDGRNQALLEYRLKLIDLLDFLEKTIP